MKQPKPVLEFYPLDGGKPQPIANPDPTPPSPTDMRWMRVQEFFRANSFRPNTLKAYDRELRRFLNWTDKTWYEITARDIANYKHELEEQGLAIASISRAIAPLKSIFKWLFASGYISENPTTNVKLPTPPEPLPQHFNLAEVEALYDAVSERGRFEKRDRAILTILEFGGLRIGEVSALNLEDFVPEGNDPAYPGWGFVIIREAKDDSTGSIPLPPRAIAILQAYLQERKDQGEPLSPDAPLFLARSTNPQRQGTRLGTHGIYTLFRELGHQAGIPDCHPHRFRHTFATRLVLMGIDSYLGRKLTRHKSERAYRRYSEYGRQIAAEQAYKQRFQDHSSGPVDDGQD